MASLAAYSFLSIPDAAWIFHQHKNSTPTTYTNNMQVQIPTIGTTYILSAPWSFTLFSEYRNSGFIEKLIEAGYSLKRGKDDYYSYTVKPVGQVTIPKGA